MRTLPVVYRIDSPETYLNVPETVTCGFGTFEQCRELLRSRKLICVIKYKGQTEGSVYGLEGAKDEVLAFAKTCKRNGFTVIRDIKGLL